MQTCEVCRFALAFPEAEEMPGPKVTFSMALSPAEMAVARRTNAVRDYRYEHKTQCRRYPDYVEKYKSDWCGEFQSNRSPDDLKSAIAADLNAGFSLRQTASRNGATFGFVRGVAKRQAPEPSA